MGCGASAPVEDKKLFNFRIRLIGGLNLFNNGFGVQAPGTKTSSTRFEGASDPYVQLECTGTQQFFESKVVLHEQNPCWNEEFYFRTNTRTPVLKLTVKDKEVVGSNTVIGTATVNLNGLIGRKEERECWVKLQGAVAKGEVGFAVVECYRTTIHVIQGVDLKPMDTLSGSSDCYLTAQVGQQTKQQTEVKGWTLNPRWNQKFTFFIPYGIPSVMELILYDRDRVGTDNNMGWYYHPMTGTPAVAPKGAAPPPPPKHEVKLANAQGTLQFELVDDDKVEVPEAPAPDAATIAGHPSKVPNSFTFDCRVIGAYNLAAADGCFIDDILNEAKGEFFHEYKDNQAKSDPFARVTCDGQTYDTHHIDNTLEPIWNEKFRFVATDRDQTQLAIQLWDHDIVANDCIGSVKLPLNMLKPGQRMEVWSLLDKGRGEVGVELTQSVMLKVKVIGAKDLPAKDMNGMCDPYVKIKIGAKEVQTRVYRNSRNPAFNEDFRFMLPTVKHVKMQLQVWDSDLMIFKKGLSEDLIGGCEVDLETIVPGLPTTMDVPIMLSGKPAGFLKLLVCNEIPLPPSAWDELEKKGKEAFDAACKKLTATKDFIATLTPANFDKKEEAVVEPAEPKFSPRPRFSRIAVEIIALRNVHASGVPVYVGISVPQNGQRFKTKEYRQIPNCDIHENFNFGVPLKLTGALEVCLFESNKHPFPGAWCNENSGRSLLKFRDANDKDGLIRGSPANDEWLALSTGGHIVVRISEMFRFMVRVKGGEGITTGSDPYVVLEMEKTSYSTNVVPKDPAKDRSTGIPGKPVWDEQFTFYANAKGTVNFRLMDDTVVGNDTQLGKGTFNLGQLRRGVPSLNVEVQLDGKGGKLICDFLEEEKMHLLDKIFDEAGNVAKLAQAAAAAAAEKAKEAVGNVGAAIGGALGGLFGK